MPVKRLLPLVIVLLSSLSVWAGPQHWGFGFGYLVTIEEREGGQRALSVYEPPMHVKDTPWLLRWRDTSTQYGDVLPAGVAVGNFWPQSMGAKEYVAAVKFSPERGYTVVAFDPPEVFSTRPWKVLREWPSTPLPADSPARKTGDEFTPPLALLAGGNRIVAVAAGNPMDRPADQLVVLTADSAQPPHYAVQIYEPPAEPNDGDWTVGTILAVSDLQSTPDERPLALTVGDFWGHEKGIDSLALVFPERIVFFALKDTGVRSPAALPGKMADRAKTMKFAVAKPRILAEQKLADAGIATPWQPGWLVAADYLKDGFVYLAWDGAASKGADPAAMFCTTAPLVGERYNTCWVRPHETFAGAKLDAQRLTSMQRIMPGQRQAAFGRVVAAGAGRIFGYIKDSVEIRKEKLWKPWTFQGHEDVEIVWAHRTPLYRMGVPKQWQDDQWPWEPDDHFGWPFKDEPVTYEIALKNNGRQTIPPGQVHLRVWVSTPDRNADILASTADRTPDLDLVIDQPMKPFDPAAVDYTIVKVPIQWPFDLVQPPGWTWKRINVREIGERWVVLRADFAGDENERNNRYEFALNSLLFRPVWRCDVDAPPGPSPDGLEGRPDRKINTVAYRAPCVTGDPESREYSGRKLADAVQCMWERSRTSDGQDVLQRVVFDSYRPYDTQDRRPGGHPLSRAEDWSYVEAPREGEHWVGLWGDYERFDPRDGGAELHETGHLTHRLGDLYHYFIFPSTLRNIRMADGTPVQMYTYSWGLDSFCSGHAIIGEGAADLHRYIEGVRYGLGWAWHKMLPDQINVRVLDRDSQPVAAAPIKMWLYPDCSLHSSGTTDTQGLWDPNFPKKRADGSPGYRMFEPFGFKQWDGEGPDALAQVLTVDLPGYSDFMIWGAEETSAHSRYMLMHESLRHRAGFTWDFHTLYKAGAPAARCDVTAAVQGRKITLTVGGPAAKRHKIYRRWEPAYTYELIEDGSNLLVSALKQDDQEVHLDPTEMDQPIIFTDDMGAEDWYRKGRFRATYYVSEVLADGTESLPKRIYGIALDKVNGVSDLGGGKLIIAENCGTAEPFGVLSQGTTPLEEYVKHYRFGHTAAKFVPSAANPQRYYVTLAASDLGDMNRYFDLVQFDKPDRHNSMYPVVQTSAECTVLDFTTAEPYTITIAPEKDVRVPVNAGDWATTEDAHVRILAIAPAADANAPRSKDRGEPLKLTVDKLLFKAEQKDKPALRIEFGGGTPGDKAELRELKKPRGLAAVTGTDKQEYVVIADTGNSRVVLWDSTSRYLATWKPEDGEFHPAAVAADPQMPGACFVLDRHADHNSRVFRLQLDGTTLKALGAPQAVNVGDSEPGPEIGLAAAVDPLTKTTVLALTDGAKKQVVQMPFDPQASVTLAPLTAAIGTFAGEVQLTNPTDVAYSLENGELRLYAVDGHNRVVRLR
jgi:hypothetical protein